MRMYSQWDLWDIKQINELIKISKVVFPSYITCTAVWMEALQ
jgi:hypothetical protein